MKGALDDIVAVFARGWKFIVGGGVLSIVGAGQQAGRAIYSGTPHHWHWPSPWWWLFLVMGIVIAQHLVIRDRRLTAASKLPPESQIAGVFIEAAQKAVSAGSSSGMKMEGVFPQAGAEPIEIRVSAPPQMTESNLTEIPKPVPPEPPPEPPAQSSPQKPEP